MTFEKATHSLSLVRVVVAINDDLNKKRDLLLCHKESSSAKKDCKNEIRM